MTACSVVLLYLASLLPVQRLGIVAISSLFGIAAVIEAGLAADVFVFIGSSLVGWLVVPDKSVILIYTLFLGYYPIVKSLAEKLGKPAAQWCIKLAVFNAALSAAWFLFSSLVFAPGIHKLGTAVVFIAGNAAFILYDIGLTKLISFYIVRISKNIRKKGDL